MAVGLALAALTLLPAGAQARTTAVSCPTDDLQTAIDAAATGDTLQITGMCTGNFVVPGSGSATKLTLQGADNATLDGDHAGPAISAENMRLNLRELDIQNGGNTTFGGGVYMTSTLLHLVGGSISGNAACAGAGIYMIGSKATISAVSVHDNEASEASGPCPFINGAGIEVDSGSELDLAHAGVTQNHVRGEFGIGGGIDLYGSTVRINDSIVAANEAGRSGGGISDQLGMLRVRRSNVRDNTAHHLSAGGLLVDGASARVVASTFTGNRAKYAGGAMLNIADAADLPNGVTGNSDLYVRDTRIAHNTVHEGGGGIVNYAPNTTNVNGGEPGTLATVEILRSKIRRNHATGGVGGGLWNVALPGGEATMTLTGTHVRGNTAQRGGGLLNNSFRPLTALGGFSKLFLTQKTSVTGNRATDKGGGVYNGPDAEIHVQSGSEVARNDPDDCRGCTRAAAAERVRPLGRGARRRPQAWSGGRPWR